MHDKILKQRWEAVDKLLSTHFDDLGKIRRELKDDIQDVLNRMNISYEELMNWADIKTLAYFKRKAENILAAEISGYVRYLISKYSTRKKLKNKDVLLALLLICYAEKQLKLEVMEFELFQNIAAVSYKQGQKEAMKVMGPKKYNPIPNTLVLLLLTLPAYRGEVWEDYVSGNTSYNAKQVYQEVVIQISQGKKPSMDDEALSSILEKQDNRYLGKKTDGKIDKYYGSLDNYATFIANQTALEGMKKQGVEKVRFIAVKDEKTTDMCDSLDNQIFYIDKLNVYSRYSKEDDANVTYETMGLQVGANLPPIDNGYHHCRSTIYPERN